MYGWYSKKQFDNYSKHSNNENDDDKYKFYLDINDKIVQVTEVNINKNFQSKYDDVFYVGELKKWVGHKIN